VDVQGSVPGLGLQAGDCGVSSGVAMPFSHNPPSLCRAAALGWMSSLLLYEMGLAGLHGGPPSPGWGKCCACRQALRLLVELCRSLVRSWATCPGIIALG